MTRLSLRTRLMASTSRGAILIARKHHSLDVLAAIRPQTEVLQRASDDPEWAADNEDRVNEAVTRLQEIGVLRPATGTLDSLPDA